MKPLPLRSLYSMIWIVVTALAVAACQELLSPGGDRVTEANQQVQSEQAATPSADTYVSSLHSGTNYGADTVLLVRHANPNDTTRALIMWDPEGIAQLGANDSVVAARIELTIVTNEDGWGSVGGLLSIHSMTSDWNEGSATWSRPDTSEPRWMMSNPQPCLQVPPDGCWQPWTPSPTDTTRIVNGQTGTVSFDVTADVVSFLQGAFWPSVTRWLVKKVDEAASGEIIFGSRESGSPPRLVLTLATGQTFPVPPTPPDSIPQAEKLRIYADSNLVNVPGWSGRSPRDIIWVAFQFGASQQERQHAIDLIGGEVVGGSRSTLVVFM